MTCSIAVLIAWRDSGCEHRARALPWVIARHARHGWPVIIGRGDETGPWIKADAIADAASQARADILVLADADVWTTGLQEAVDAVRAGAPWAIAHRAVHRLTEASTTAYMAGAELGELELAERAYLGVAGGGITVLRRDVLDDCPLDPRFEGWGGEDESHAIALHTLYGVPWRGRAPLVHLWHPPAPRATRTFGNQQSLTLRKRYVRAQPDPTAIRALIQEARAHGDQRSAQPPRRAEHPLSPR